MTIVSAIYTRLQNTPTLTALIGTRAYRLIAPQGVIVPFVTYKCISSIREQGMGSDTGIVNSRWQFNAVAQSYEICSSICEGLLSGLQRWRDEAASVPVIDTSIEDVIDGYDDDTALFNNIFELRIWYRE